MDITELKGIRERANLTREELAAKLKVSLRTIYRWEKGEAYPHRVFMEKLNRIFSKIKGSGANGNNKDN